MAATTAAAAAALRSYLSFLSGGGRIPNPTLQTLFFVSPLPLHHRRRRGVLRSNASSSPSPSPPPSPEKEAEAIRTAEAVRTAESCVNLGLELFSKGRVGNVLEQFDNALELDPNPV